MPDLGSCTVGGCTRPADRAVAGGLLRLCDPHALARAIEKQGPCPHCAGDPTRGMHRGQVIGQGEVKTCSSTKAQRALQGLTDAVTGATESVVQLGEILKEDSPLRQEIEDGKVEDVDPGESLGYADPVSEEGLRAIKNDRGPRLSYEFGDDPSDPFKDAKLVGIERGSVDEDDGSIVIEGERYERADEVIMGEEPEGDDGWSFGDECLTDDERNPNINRDLRSYD